MSGNVSITSKEINALRDQLNELKQKKDNLLIEIRRLEAERKKYKEERDLHNTNAAEFFAKVNDLKSRRDSTNTEIKEMKQIRQDVLAEMKLLIQKAQSLREDLRQEPPEPQKKKGTSSRKLRRHIEDLEWRIQTTPAMSIVEEREIMSQVEELASQLNERTASQTVKKELSRINTDIENLKRYLDETWKNFNDLVSSSQEQHKRLTELYEQGKAEKEDADLNHKLFVQRSQQLRQLRQDFVKTRKELQQVYNEFKEKSDAHKELRRESRKRRQTKIVDSRLQEILDKRDKRKALTFEEMRILMDHNLLEMGKKEEEPEDESESIEAEAEAKAKAEIAIQSEAEPEIQANVETEMNPNIENKTVEEEAKAEIAIQSEANLSDSADTEKPVEESQSASNELETVTKEVEKNIDVELITGIGKSIKEKLGNAGVNSILELVNADAKELAEKLGKRVSEKKVETWIQEGKKILEQE
ncbi:MAG: hypothetical protein ACFFBD_03365 [Candidatus Hodarchaeota archaeon]